MAGGNFPKGSSNKPSASSSSHRKSRWESGNTTTNNTAPANKSSPAAAAGGNPKHLPAPPHPRPKSQVTPKDNNLPPKPSPSQQKPIPGPSPHSRPGPSPSGAPFPFLDNMGPPLPPAYDFHMLDRRTIALADGSVRSYFALPPDYQDFTPPVRFLPNNLEMPGQGVGFDHQFPMSPDFRDVRNRNHEYWNSNSQENSLKRKYVEEGEKGRREERDERDNLARQRQHLLQYGNAGSNPNWYLGTAGTSSMYGQGDEGRAAKYMRGDQVVHNVGHNKHNEVDQGALKKAFLHFAKLIYENGTLKKSYLADGKQGPLQCVACSRSSKDFPDMHSLIMHTYNSDSAELLVDHLGLHKVLCILMGWNYLIPPDNLKAYQSLSADEAAANRDDLIMWPPVVIIRNTMTGKGREGRIEGLGNRMMDNKLRDLGFSGGKSKSMYNSDGHQGVTLVKYAGDQSGFKEAMRLAEFFEKENHGRRSWAVVQNLVSTKDGENNPNIVRVNKNTGEKDRVLYGYLGTVADLDRVDTDTRKKVVIESIREYKLLK